MIPGGASACAGRGNQVAPAGGRQALSGEGRSTALGRGGEKIMSETSDQRSRTCHEFVQRTLVLNSLSDAWYMLWATAIVSTARTCQESLISYLAPDRRSSKSGDAIGTPISAMIQLVGRPVPSCCMAFARTRTSRRPAPGSVKYFRVPLRSSAVALQAGSLTIRATVSL
ncbi:hypothetical protein QE372_002931 [Agrobacterium pusense]|nr:hypothetical protein [Agrobacterium pusense]